MTLSPRDEHRLAELIQAQRVRGLTFPEEEELRRLLRSETPATEEMTVGELVGVALMVIGAGALLGWLVSKAE